MALGGLLWLGLAVWLFVSGLVLVINAILIELESKSSKSSKKEGKDFRKPYCESTVGGIFRESLIIIFWCIVFPVSGIAIFFIWKDAIGHTELGGTTFLTDEAPNLNLTLYDAANALHFIEMFLSIMWTYFFFYKSKPKAGLFFVILLSATAVTVTSLAYVLSIAGGVLYTIYTIWTIFEVGINVAYLMETNE